MEHTNKRRKLADMGRAHFASKSAMQALFDQIGEYVGIDLPAVDRKMIQRACDASSNIDTAFGKVMQTVTVAGIDIPFLAPVPLLQHLLDDCPPFADWFSTCVRTSPPSMERPWKLAVYCDEVSPGNQLKVLNHRKVQVFYWSFVDLQYMGEELMWFPWAVVRSTTVTQLAAGMSQLCRSLFKTFFDAAGVDLKNSGAMLQLNGSIVHLFATPAVFVADESALHGIWLNKAAAGIVPCLLCANCASHWSNLHRYSAIHVPNTCVDVSKFVLHSKATLYALCDELSDANTRMTRADLGAFETSIGLNYNAEGLWHTCAHICN